MVSFHLALPQTAISDQTPIDPALPGPNNLFGFANLGRFQVFPPAMDAARAANLALRNAQRLQLRAAVSPRVSAAVFTTAVASFSSTYLGPLSFLDSDLDFIACFNSLSPPIVSFAQNYPVHASFTTAFSPSLRSAIFNVLFNLLQSDYVGVAYNDSLQVTNVIRASQRDQIPHPRRRH